MKQKKIVLAPFDTYLATVKNSVGSKLFRNYFAFVNGKKNDIMDNGDLSCAFFVSALLKINNLLPDIHGTVNGTEIEMKKNNWKKIKNPKIGSVLVWQALKFKNGGHKHIGFYIGKNKAISNSSRGGYPRIHHWTFGTKNGEPKRRIEVIYWNKKLENK